MTYGAEEPKMGDEDITLRLKTWIQMPNKAEVFSNDFYKKL